MSRPTSAMESLKMTAPFKTSRRKAAGYIVKWSDPISGRRRQKTLGTRQKRRAWELAAQLAEDIESGSVVGGLPWLTFCKQYEKQHLKKRAPKSLEGWHTVKWFVEEKCPVRSIHQCNDVWIDRFLDALIAKIDAEKLAVNTEATYMARLRAALSWACKKRHLKQMPYIAVEWERKPRSDSVTPKQFQAMLEAIPEVRPNDWRNFRRALLGQYYTGLRISEILELSWDPGAAKRVVGGDDADLSNLSGLQENRPVIRFETQKNDKRQVRPLVPEAWEIISDTPVRKGFVFPIQGKDGQMSVKRFGDRIRDIAEKAGVITGTRIKRHKKDKYDKKTKELIHRAGDIEVVPSPATSHDIRRAFFDWAKAKYGKKIASILMRHADQETTEDFYNTREADELAGLLWGTR